MSKIEKLKEKVKELEGSIIEQGNRIAVLELLLSLQARVKRLEDTEPYIPYVPVYPVSPIPTYPRPYDPSPWTPAFPYEPIWTGSNTDDASDGAVRDDVAVIY